MELADTPALKAGAERREGSSPLSPTSIWKSTLPNNYSYCKRPDVFLEAKRQVHKKFPDLREGTSGWYRAFNNRLKRLLICT